MAAGLLASAGLRFSEWPAEFWPLACFGLIGEIVIGGWLFGLFGITVGGLIGSLIAALIGAIILIFIIRLIKRA